MTEFKDSLDGLSADQTEIKRKISELKDETEKLQNEKDNLKKRIFLKEEGTSENI